MVAPARRTLRDFEETLAAVHNVKELRSGRLVVVAQPHLAADALPQLLGPFHDQYPDVAISITAASDADILAVLRSRGADVGLDFALPREPGVNGSRLADEEVFLVFPPGTSDIGTVIPASALDDVALIAPNTPEHGPVRQWIRDIGINAPILVETAHRLATIPLVLSGLGAALLARPLARQAVALGALACRLDPPIYRPAFLIDVPPSHLRRRPRVPRDRRGGPSIGARTRLDTRPKVGRSNGRSGSVPRTRPTAPDATCTRGSPYDKTPRPDRVRQAGEPPRGQEIAVQLSRSCPSST